MGVGGGKGTGGAAPAPEYDNSANEMMMSQMSQMMQMMPQFMAQSAMMSSMPQQPQATPLPPIESPLDIDWTDKNESLAQKARADYMSDRAKRHGRTDTILTSPLLDESESSDTGSTLLGIE